MDMQAVYEHIELEDLTGDLRDIAEAVGIEPIRKLMLDFKGAELYVPVKPPRLALLRFVTVMGRRGYTMGQIARQTGVKARTLRAWMKEEKATR